LKAVRSETVRVVGHRDGEARSAAGLLSLQQRSEDVDYRVQRPAREVRDLDRRQSGRGFGEQARPAEIVQIVPWALVVRAEAGYGAVDDGGRNVARPDSESLGDTRSEALEHDVGAPAEGAPEVGVAFEIPYDGFLAGVDRSVPARSDGPERVTLGRLDAHDPRCPLEKLPTGERARQVPREVDD
jgi:hypothetical protein